MDTKSALWIGGGMLALLALVFGIGTMRTASVPTEASPLLALAADDHVKGAENAKVVVVEYLDFECPACGSYVPVVKQMEEEFGDRVTFAVRYFPLSGHKNGISSALAVEAAGRQGKFWEMHDLLFSKQSEWEGKQAPTPAAFEAYAQQLGLDMERFKADVASKEVAARVNRDRDAGTQVGINSTPTFFVNGRKIQNPSSPEAFRALIQSELDA